MKRSTRMLLMNNGRNGDDRLDYSRKEYDSGRMNDRRSEYSGDSYGPDSRFRDRRGREHYDNGRFAPMDDGRMGAESRFYPAYNGGQHEVYSHYPMTTPYVPPVYKNEDQRGWQRPMNKIGFSLEGEMGKPDEFGSGYRSDAGYRPMDEMQIRPGSRENGYASSGSGPMTKEMAYAWVSNMENEDGTRGPHWNIEQVKQVMAQYNINGSPWDVFAVLNSIYSDYCKVFRKYGVGDNIGFYIDMAKAWMDDSDSVKNKAAAYFENVVKH